MKYVKLAAVYSACFLVQSTFFNSFRIFGVTANLILALTIVLSFFFGNYEGLAFGAVFGIIQDICFSPVTGISACMYILTGILLQMLRFSVYRDNKIIMLILTVLATAVYNVGSAVLCNVLMPGDTGIIYALSSVPAASLLNYAAVLAVYHFAKRREGFTV